MNVFRCFLSWVAFLSINLIALCSGIQLRAQSNVSLQHIQEVDIVTLSHLDVGFTDLPSTVRELQQRYIDVALDLCIESKERRSEERFYWTVESQLPLWDWWQAANIRRRADLVRCVRSGQIDVGAFAFNQQPFLSSTDWHTMSHWVPDSLWHQLKPTVGIQDDVNGLPRRGVVELLDRGIGRLWMGMNSDGGGPPFAAPAAFWWKMPDGRRVFTYLAAGYFQAQNALRPNEWRRGPTPRAYNLQYHSPSKGEVLDADPTGLEASQKRLLSVLKDAEAHGYKAQRYIMSFSNEWRGDNDPPFAELPAFIAAWNCAGLKPRLRLTTVSKAMVDLEHDYGSQAPEFSGEWTDWWADGEPSDPRVVSAAREAERTLAAATSPVWQGGSPDFHKRVDRLRRDLTLFDEHTWGSSWSIAFPHGYDSEAQYAEKVLLAYRPSEISKWLLSQRARWTLRTDSADMAVVNTGELPWSGWVDLEGEALRNPVRSARDDSSGTVEKLEFSPDVRVKWPENSTQLSNKDDYGVFPDLYPSSRARLWVSNLAAHSTRDYTLVAEPTKSESSRVGAVRVQTDRLGWPTGATWDSGTSKLFDGSIGGFESIEVTGDNPRELAVKMADARSGVELDRLRAASLHHVLAVEEHESTREENQHTIVYRQMLSHPRLRWMERELEIWKNEARARLTVRFSRIPSSSAEAFFVTVDLPSPAKLPVLSDGGMSFAPYVDQIPGTCMDYFAFDGWAKYAGDGGQWLWFSRDAPVVSFGSPELFPHLTSAPPDSNRISSMVYNNTWYVNWVADAAGEMSFQYDLIWQNDVHVDPARLANNLWLTPTVILNPGKIDPVSLQDIYRP